jgi:hypothetical protein
MLRALSFGWLLVLSAVPVSIAEPAPYVDRLEALDERVEAVEETLADLGVLLGGGFLLALLTLVGLWWHLLRKARRYAEERVARLVEGYPGKVEQLIEHHETEGRLRRESRIAVVGQGLATQGLLKQLGFREVKTVPPVTAHHDALDGYKAVVLDLQDGVPVATAAALIDASPRDAFLVYSTGSGRVDLPPGRATFANSPITLYARLLELLRFLDAGDRR